VREVAQAAVAAGAKPLAGAAAMAVSPLQPGAASAAAFVLPSRYNAAVHFTLKDSCVV